MPSTAHAPAVNAPESVKDKLTRYRAQIAANPHPMAEESKEVKRHKLELFEEWSDLRHEASETA